MKTLSALVVSAVMTGAAIGSPAMAWNAKGHMMVAEVAWRNMGGPARARAAELLKKNPDYARWTAGVSDPAARDQVAFVQAATWPDDIRDTKEDDGYTPVEPQASENSRGYDDPFVHAYCTHAYASPIRDRTGPYVITKTYSARTAKDARERVALAGRRLARLLDANLR